MSQGFRRFVPVIALCLTTLLGGCVIVPEHHAYWGGPGWGYRR